MEDASSSRKSLLDIPLPALAPHLAVFDVLNLAKTCKALAAAAENPHIWDLLARKAWPPQTLRCGGAGCAYASMRDLVIDGNRCNAELALDLGGLVSDYRFKRPAAFWYQCRLLRLLWRRGPSESLRLLIDARGEADLRPPYAPRGATSCLAVLSLPAAAVAAVAEACVSHRCIGQPLPQPQDAGTAAAAAVAATYEAAIGVVFRAAPDTPQPLWLRHARAPPGCERWSFPADGFEPAEEGGRGPASVGNAAPAQQQPQHRHHHRQQRQQQQQGQPGHYRGTLAWGAAKAQAIVALLEGEGDGSDGVAFCGGGRRSDAGARVLVFCYCNRMGELGRVGNAPAWLDYTVVPLLVVGAPDGDDDGTATAFSRPGAFLERAWRAAPHSAGFECVGAAEARLKEETAAAQRARWRAGTPQEVLDRGWYV